jgi:hypothetical protein
MGLFGFGKKNKVTEVSTDFASQSMPDFNQGFGQGRNNPYGDPLTNQNSGLKLADLNNQDLGFNPQESGVDSFGNPRVAQRVENYDYNKTQQFGAQDNSKDFQLILAKLDAIRSEITNINHRLDNIERHQTEQPQQKKYPW